MVELFFSMMLVIAVANLAEGYVENASNLPNE